MLPRTAPELQISTISRLLCPATNLGVHGVSTQFASAQIYDFMQLIGFPSKQVSAGKSISALKHLKTTSLGCTKPNQHTSTIRKRFTSHIRSHSVEIRER